MSLPITHAIVPVATVVAFGGRNISGRLFAATVIGATLPDLDLLMRPLFSVPLTSVFGHRGAFHSLFAALLAGAVGAGFHRPLKATPLGAGVAVAAAMASHGLLDMMTASGKGVAYLWPVTSIRLYADWRPLPGSAESNGYRLAAIVDRMGPEWHRAIAPIMVGAVAIHVVRRLLIKAVR